MPDFIITLTVSWEETDDNGDENTHPEDVEWEHYMPCGTSVYAVHVERTDEEVPVRNNTEAKDTSERDALHTFLMEGVS